MSRRAISYTILAGAILTFLAIVTVDQPVARWVDHSGGRSSAFLTTGTKWLEVLSFATLSKFFLGSLLAAAGLLCLAAKATRTAGRMLLLVGCTHLVTRLVAGVLKIATGRMRPFEMIQSGTWDTGFFRDGNAFPSGHAAHFWGLFFPLAFLFPKLRLPLLILPVFISFARVGVNDHWVSDVLGSLTLAALINAILVRLFRFIPPPNDSPSESA